MTTVKSKFDGKSYKLYDYVWRPQDKNQGVLI